MSRADFSSKVKRLIAERSGYRCSFPGCGLSTIGPGASVDESESVGVAAHIFAASPEGPRGKGGLTDSELIQASNGIWVCAIHSRVIDNKDGVRFPSALLLSYKALHEARIAREVLGITSSLGWFHEIIINESAVFSEKAVARLGKLTLIIGSNGTGKTALCEWISGFEDVMYLSRWRGRRRGRRPTRVSLKLHNPEETTLGFELCDDGRVDFAEDGVPRPFLASPMKVVYPGFRSEMIRDQVDDLGRFSQLLGLEKGEIMNLADEIQRFEPATIANIVFEEAADGQVDMKLDVSGTEPQLSFKMLSGREKNRVIVEFGMAAARSYARHVPTLLILDNLSMIFFEKWFEFYANHFSDSQSLFQTIVVMPDTGFDAERLRWQGWEVIRTRDRTPNVTIGQSIRSSGD